MNFTKLLTALTLGASFTALAAPCPTRASWPTTDWPTAGVTNKAAEVKALEDYAFRTIGTERQRFGIRTDGMVIVKGGNIIFEKYARGWSAKNRHLSWSVAKSISSALIGVAVQKGALSLDDSICKYLTGYEGKPICSTKVKNFITFSPGLQWQENYEDQGYQGSSVISMLLGVGHRDQLGFVLSQSQQAAPGTQFNYSTGFAHVAGALAKAALKPGYGNDAFWDLLFTKIGMTHTTFEEDPKGNPLGGSYVYAPVREFAKFGYLFLNDGCWAGERLLPENWVAQSTTPNDTFRAAPQGAVPSGYMWWLNQPAKADAAKPYKDLPADTYIAIGHWGQYVVVIPSLDLVITRVGDDRVDCPASAVDGKVDGIECDLSLNKLTALAIEVAK